LAGLGRPPIPVTVVTLTNCLTSPDGRTYYTYDVVRAHTHTRNFTNSKAPILRYVFIHCSCVIKQYPVGLIHKYNIVTDLINALPGNSSVNTVQYAIIDEAVFSMSSVPRPVLVTDQ
jgi:hypothetical protein